MFNLLALLLFFVVFQNRAQISGIVQDENGQPVAAAGVILRSATTTLRTNADERGRFQFDSVPPGDYLIDFKKTGFFQLSHFPTNAKSGLNDITVTLNHEYEIRSEVDVLSEPHEIAPQQMAHEEQVVGYEIREDPVPSSHNLQNALPALPGVVQDNMGQLHVAGARAEDTLYVLDGFEIDNPASGAFDARVNIDVVREADVSAGRYGAQLANAGSGVLALQTDTGDDRWRFGITNFLPGFTTRRGTHLGNWFPRVNVSGPLEKGRAWFSDGASLQHVFTLVRELPRGSDISQSWSGDNLLRAQYNLTPSHSLQSDFLYNASTASRVGLNAFAPAATTRDERTHRYFLAGKDQITLHNGLIEVALGSDTSRLERQPEGSQTFVLTPAGPQGNYFESQVQNSHRWQGRGDLTLFGRQLSGPHDIQLGFEADRTHLDQASDRHLVEMRQSNLVLMRQASFLGNAHVSVSNMQSGGYVQDLWHIRPDFILQSSFRVDRNDFIDKLQPQPRLVLNWMPRPNSKFSAGWGWYYQRVYLSLIAQAHDQQRLDVLMDAPLITSFLIRQKLRQPYSEMASAEWQQQWTEHTSSTVHVMHRRQHNGLAYENVSTDPFRRDLQLNDRRRDHYRAIEVTMRHSIRSGSDLMVGYLYSRARSNEIFDYSVDDLVLANQSSGPLAWDVPHRVISRGAFQTKFWNLLLSYFAEYHTGFPFSGVNSRYEVVGVPNGFRFPPYFAVNIGAEKRFPFYGRQWAVRLSVINATGHHNYNAVINNIDAPNFLSFAGGQSRALTARLRLVGRK